MVDFVFETENEKKSFVLFEEWEGLPVEVRKIEYALPPQAMDNWNTSANDAGSVCVYWKGPRTNKDFVGVVQIRDMDETWKTDYCVIQQLDNGNYERTVYDWKKDNRSFGQNHYISGGQPLSVSTGSCGFTIQPA